MTIRAFTGTVLLAAALAARPPIAAAASSSRRALAVAAASNLKPAMDDLERGFEAAHPDVDVAVTIGASGLFFAQIQNGAPFDVFFSADREYPRRAVEAGLGSPDGEVVYAIGKLAAWARRDAGLDLARRGLGALASPTVKKLAIANPAVAPYGRAAEAALRTAGLYDAVKDRLVLGQNISQAAQFAQSGAADAALIPLSLALSPQLAGGDAWTLAEGTYPPIEQSALVLRGARDPGLASAFLRYVTGPAGREILARHGYSFPP